MPKVSAKYKLNYLIYCEAVHIVKFGKNFSYKTIVESRKLYIEYPEIVKQLQYTIFHNPSIQQHIRSMIQNEKL